jgi:hypothetical protein
MLVSNSPSTNGLSAVLQDRPGSYLSPVLIDSTHCPIKDSNVQLGALARDKRRRILVGHRLRLSFGKRVAFSKQSKVRLTSPSLTTIVLPEDPFRRSPDPWMLCSRAKSLQEETQAAILDNFLTEKLPSCRMRHWSSITCWLQCVAKKPVLIRLHPALSMTRGANPAPITV